MTMKDHRPKSVELSLAARHLGGRRHATRVGSDLVQGAKR